MRDILKVLFFFILFFGGLFAIQYGSLMNLNFFGPKFEDVRRNVVQHSLRRQEGVSEGIGALCLNMKLEKDPASRSALAQLIIVQGTATGTQLTTEAATCVAEAKTTIGI